MSDPLDQLYGPDLVLLLLGAPTRVSDADKQIRGITRLEKILFLADQEGDVQKSILERLQFVPYHYGPYSREVYQAVELLQEAGLIRELRTLDPDTVDDMEEVFTDATEEEGVERCFQLTEEGVDVAHHIGRAFPNTWRTLSKIKDTYAGMPLRKLIRSVYTRYPKYAEKSRIRNEIL